MSEGEVRQIASLEKSLLDSIRKFHNDFIVSAKIVESMPETLQRGFSDISMRLQDQIDFLGSLEIAKAQSKYASKKSLIEEEIKFLEQKQDQIREDVKRLLLKYIENQELLDKQASQRTRELDSHVNEILDSDYKKKMKNSRTEYDLVFDEVMQAINQDVAQKRKQLLVKQSEESHNIFREFIEKRKSLKEKIEKVKSNIKTEEKIELFVPFYIVKIKDISGEEKLKIFMPSKLAWKSNEESSVRCSLEKMDFLSEYEKDIYAKMLDGIKKLKFKLEKIYGSESIGRGLKELERSDFFTEQKEKLLSIIERDYSIRSL